MSKSPGSLTDFKEEFMTLAEDNGVDTSKLNLVSSFKENESVLDSFSILGILSVIEDDYGVAIPLTVFSDNQDSPLDTLIDIIYQNIAGAKI